MLFRSRSSLYTMVHVKDNFRIIKEVGNRIEGNKPQPTIESLMRNKYWWSTCRNRRRILQAGGDTGTVVHHHLLLLQFSPCPRPMNIQYRSCNNTSMVIYSFMFSMNVVNNTINNGPYDDNVFLKIISNCYFHCTCSIPKGIMFLVIFCKF